LRQNRRSAERRHHAGGGSEAAQTAAGNGARAHQAGAAVARDLDRFVRGRDVVDVRTK
jgi:hypothetical protein